MDGREIPGFYYDQEKKKYFKILPNHVTPAGSRYSKENVEKEKQAEKARELELARRTAVQTQLLQRSKILSSPTASGISVTRETAEEIRPLRHANEVAKAYGEGIREAWRKSMNSDIRAFATDPSTDSYLIGQGSFEWQEFGAAYISANRNKQRVAYREISIFRQNQISSISLSPARVAMITTIGNGEPAQISISPLADRAFGLPPISHVQITFRRPDETDVWSCAANPFLHDGSIFATGLSEKVIIYSDAEAQWTGDTLLTTQTDAHAVEWLGPTILASGLRSGAIHLSDTRSKGSALRLQHPAAITGIRRTTAETLVVCGLQDSLAMYDLRMPLTDNIGAMKGLPQPKRRKHAAHSLDKICSQPVLIYDFKSGLSHMGFDVSTETNLLAAVDGNNLVQLYTLQNGHKIKTLTVEDARKTPQEARKPVRQLQFTTTGSEDKYSRQQLVACCGKELVGFRW